MIVKKEDIQLKASTKPQKGSINYELHKLGINYRKTVDRNLMCFEKDGVVIIPPNSNLIRETLNILSATFDVDTSHIETTVS